MGQGRLPDFLCCKAAPSNSTDLTPHERSATGSPRISTLGAPASGSGLLQQQEEGAFALVELTGQAWGSNDLLINSGEQHRTKYNTAWLSSPGITSTLLMKPLCCHSPGESGTSCLCTTSLSVEDSESQTSSPASRLKLSHGVRTCQSLLLSFSQEGLWDGLRQP